jgi:squalene synthase HpnC
MRPHVAAVYAFARVADDMADEGDAAPAERRRRLAAWRSRLHDAVESRPVRPTDRGDLIVIAAANSIAARDLPIALFDDLISAFEQDTDTNRYNSWTDLMDYCRRSANPVGRLVLRIAGYRDAALDRASDALCTALQLTNFWEDFGPDWRAGRLYVPQQVLLANGADERDLGAGRLTPPWAAALADCVAFTRAAYAEGRAVCDAVRGRLRLELRMTWLGGVRVLDRVFAGRTVLLQRRPALGAPDVPRLLWQAARWRRAHA